MINSDKGVLYYSGIYIGCLEEQGYLRNMSRIGYCWQNSPIVNGFYQLREECIRINGLSTI